jgi:hypothetical protein
VQAANTTTMTTASEGHDADWVDEVDEHSAIGSTAGHQSFEPQRKS